NSHNCARAAPFAPLSSVACAPACRALAAPLHTSDSGLAAPRLAFPPPRLYLSSPSLPPTLPASVPCGDPLRPRFPATWPLGAPLASFASLRARLAPTPSSAVHPRLSSLASLLDSSFPSFGPILPSSSPLCKN